MNPLVKYTLARLAFFLVPFVAFVMVGFDVVASALFATVIALLLSLFTLRSLRSAASAHLDSLSTRAGKGEYDGDMAVEDRIVDNKTDG